MVKIGRYCLSATLPCLLVGLVWFELQPEKESIESSATVRLRGAELGEWTQDLDAARKLALKENKYLLINFTGSDWCGWCRLMDEHVFSQPGWKSFAKKNLALVFIDFPREKALVPEKYRSRNKELKERYGVRGYPTFIICGPDGHLAGELGAIKSGTEYNFITNVTAVFVEDRLPEYVTESELAEYREAQREKATWEATNAQVQARFREEYAVPRQKAVDEIDRLKLEILRKGAAVWRTRQTTNERAKDAEIVFADSGRGVQLSGAAFGRWTADFEAAKTLARASGKDLLLAFVGPGWCKWGDDMEREVFNTEEWMSFAKEHFVLVYLDCPDEKSESRLPESVLEQNAALYKRYGLPGCPYFLLTDAEGCRYDAFGATSGITPQEQISALELLLARKNLKEYVSEDDYNSYTNAVEREHAISRNWRKAYDEFIEEMDRHVKLFEPIAEKRNRIFEKGLKVYLESEK